MSLSFSWKWPGSHSASSPRMRGIRNHWTISVIENPTSALSSHEPSPVVHLSLRALIANSKPKHKLTARFFVLAKQDFAIRFSALISSYRPLMTCLISSCPPASRLPHLPESGLALRQLSACSPVCPLASRWGFVAPHTLESRASLRAAPVLQLYQSGQTELFLFRWRVLLSGRHARHYEMGLCYLKFKLGCITDSDVMFGSIFNLSSDTTAGLAPVLRPIISKVHPFEWDKNIFLWATYGPCVSHPCSFVLWNSIMSQN